MTIYDRIAGLCNAQNISVNALSTILNISNGNHATWKKGNIKVEHLLKICNYLQTSADYLLGLHIKQVTSAELSENENILLSFFRECSENSQKILLDLAEHYSRQDASAKEKEKIYV
jgi:transcriptional regulator with XRE-family HTH domain